MAQALLEFGEQLEAKPIHPEDVPAKAEPEYELRRVNGARGDGIWRASKIFRLPPKSTN